MYQGSVAGFRLGGRLRRTPVQQVALMHLKLLPTATGKKKSGSGNGLNRFLSFRRRRCGVASHRLEVVKLGK